MLTSALDRFLWDETTCGQVHVLLSTCHPSLWLNECHRWNLSHGIYLSNAIAVTRCFRDNRQIIVIYFFENDYIMSNTGFGY